MIEITMGMSCTRCVSDTSVQPISFNSDGVCSYCEEYEKWRPILTDFPTLHKLWMERIENLKGIGEYDVVLGLSGGKDSSYVLYQLVTKYHLKVKAVTVNKDMTAWARERLESLVSELGVAHEYLPFPRDELRPLFQLGIMVSGVPCLACGFYGYSTIVKTAHDAGIPLSTHGRSRSQMFQILLPGSTDPFLPFIFTALKPMRETNYAQLFQQIHDQIVAPMPPEPRKVFDSFFPKIVAGETAVFAPYFLYHPYDERKIITELETQTKWRRPATTDILTHADCAAHDGAAYINELVDGRPFIMWELSVLVREGTLTRLEAQTRLERARFTSVPEESLKALANNYGFTVRTLLSNAKRVAQRKQTGQAGAIGTMRNS